MYQQPKRREQVLDQNSQITIKNMFSIRHATTNDAAAIAEIYNDAVASTTAIWNDVLVDTQNRETWLTDRTNAGYPVFVAVSRDSVIGYASYGPWRAFDGFALSAELSVYVHKDHRGKGQGRSLLQTLIDSAKEQGLHVLIAGIDANNEASIALHAALGFKETARMPQVGKKFGRWLDLVFLQLQLDERYAP